MSTTETKFGPGANAEATAAWDGPLYDRFVRFRDIVTGGLAAHGHEALRACPPHPGQRVLDIGCGFGDTTQEIATLVRPGGEAVGVEQLGQTQSVGLGNFRERVSGFDCVRHEGISFLGTPTRRVNGEPFQSFGARPALTA